MSLSGDGPYLADSAVGVSVSSAVLACGYVESGSVAYSAGVDSKSYWSVVWF